MTSKDVLSILEFNKCQQSASIFRRLKDNNLECFGVQIGKLEKLAKQLGKNHAVAMELWQTNIFDARMLACLLAEPLIITDDELNMMVKRTDVWLISHILCSRLIPKTPNVDKLAVKWIDSENNHVKRCGYLSLAHLSRTKKCPDEFFYPVIERIQNNIQNEENFVKDAMNSALYYFGKRNEELRLIILDIIRDIGSIEVDYGDNSCTPINIKYHLGRSKHNT